MSDYLIKSRGFKLVFVRFVSWLELICYQLGPLFDLKCRVSDCFHVMNKMIELWFFSCGILLVQSEWMEFGTKL